MRHLPVLALGLLVAADAWAAAPVTEVAPEPVKLTRSVALTGGTVAATDALLAGIDGGQLEVASLASLLPHVPTGTEFRVTQLTAEGDLVRVRAVSRDGRIQLLLPMLATVREMVDLRYGDVLTARVRRDLLMVFSKGESPLGFLLKPGVTVTRN